MIDKFSLTINPDLIQGEYSQAASFYEQAIAVEPSILSNYWYLGASLLLQGQEAEAQTTWMLPMLEGEPEQVDLWTKDLAQVLLNLARIYYTNRRYPEALQLIEKYLEIDSASAIGHYYLGLILEKLNNISGAIQAYQDAIAIDPNYVDAYNDLGNLLALTRQFQQAEIVYRQAIATNPNHFGAYLNLGNLLWKQNQFEPALAAYHQARKLNPTDPDIINNIITILEDYGQTLSAIQVADQASNLMPDNLSFKLRKHLTIPLIYENEEEIPFYRDRFLKGLQEITQQISLSTPEAVNNAFFSISYTTNFYLAYQGENDLEPQKQYGQLVHQIMVAKYPQWVQSLPIPPLGENGKIRVGYVSGYFHTHTVGRLMLGWLKQSNKDKFEIRSYYIGNKPDNITEQYRQNSDVFHHIPDDLEAVCNQIINDKLHILVFTDIGMLPPITLMAGLRLAPTQCVAWGHPMTTGSPTIDYFLSSEMMEPENAQEHYSEQLIQLPNISISYAKPEIPEVTKTRTDFNLREQSVVYLSCQSLFKYLPQYDYVFPAIAKRVNNAQFAFISHSKNYITEKFRQRLQKAFASYGLNSEDYCVIVAGQSWNGYLSLNLLSDIYLDTFSWSGGNTTLEAIACNLPVVTCPGKFMRGRHSYAILKMLGVTETIASNLNEYIDIAVKLGQDKVWRETIVKSIKKQHSCLYNDQSCVVALEEFYQSWTTCR